MKRPQPRRPWRTVLKLSLVLFFGLSFWFFALIRPARARREDSLQAALVKARDALRRGHPKVALNLVAAASDTGRFAGEVLAVKGLAYAAFQEPEVARSFLEKSIERNPPGDPMVLKVLAAVYFNEDEPAAGFETLRKASLVDPSDFRPWYATGHFQLRLQNRPIEAIEAFREALKRQPEHLESRVELSEALLAIGRNDEASEVVNRLLVEHGGDPRVLKQAAVLANQCGNFDKAEQLAGRCLESDATDIDALVLRANVRLRCSRAQEALVDAERAVTVAPQSLAALVSLARIENALGLMDRAAETSGRLAKAREAAELVSSRRRDVRNRPNDAERRWKLGQAAAAAGLIDLARKSYQAALMLDSNFRPAAESLAAIKAAPAQ